MGKAGIDFRKVKDDKGTSGTLAHDMIERAIKGAPPPPHDPSVPEELRHEAELAFAAFEDWYAKAGITVIATEVSLVSELLKFGGTLDFLCRNPDGQLCIGDFKTSKRIYPEAWIQIAAYRLLWQENHPEDRITTGRIVRFDKDAGTWDEVSLDEKDLVLAERAFLDLLAAYSSVGAVEKRAKRAA